MQDAERLRTILGERAAGLGMDVDAVVGRRARVLEQIEAARQRGELVNIDGGAEGRRRRRRSARRIMTQAVGTRPPRRASQNWAAHDELWRMLLTPVDVSGAGAAVREGGARQTSVDR